jgi:hypothetical protein
MIKAFIKSILTVKRYDKFFFFLGKKFFFFGKVLAFFWRKFVCANLDLMLILLGVNA